MINPYQKTPIKWEKIFDEKYNFEEYFQPSQLGGIDILTGLHMLKTDIKAFISSLLKQQIEEVRGKVKDITKDIERSYLITEHKKGHDESYPIGNLLDRIFKLFV